MTQWGVFLGGLAGFLAILGGVIRFMTSPVRRLVDDLGPLTKKNDDGMSVFDEMRTQQKQDGLTLKHLAEEFPKNGVPTRATIDQIKQEIVALRENQVATAAELAEVRTQQAAHVHFHLEGGGKV